MRLKGTQSGKKAVFFSCQPQPPPPCLPPRLLGSPHPFPPNAQARAQNLALLCCICFHSFVSSCRVQAASIYQVPRKSRSEMVPDLPERTLSWGERHVAGREQTRLLENVPRAGQERSRVTRRESPREWHGGHSADPVAGKVSLNEEIWAGPGGGDDGLQRIKQEKEPRCREEPGPGPLARSLRCVRSGCERLRWPPRKAAARLRAGGRGREPLSRAGAGRTRGVGGLL